MRELIANLRNRIDLDEAINCSSIAVDSPDLKQLLEKCNGLARLLVECRDALPAISLASARLRGIDLSLADRIEAALEPWEDPNGQ